MGFFKRSSTPDEPFWRVRPIRSSDPSVLYELGISCISHEDGKRAMATGWAIWDLAGLHEHKAWDFLTDGYRSWRKASDDERTLAVEFLIGSLWPACVAAAGTLARPLQRPAGTGAANRHLAHGALLGCERAT